MSSIAVTFSNATSTNGTTDKYALLQGWTSSPNGRGTLDIVWACALTIFLCSWSVLCLNVPAQGDSWWLVNRRKLQWMFLGVIGPEFILQSALGQWNAARDSVKEFDLLGYKGWTMTNAFFADMGGFVLQTKDWKPFPLNAKQLHYLVARGYIDYSQVGLDEKTIEDKNGNDNIARLITVTQIIWFTITIIMRLFQHVAITTLELTTIGFIVCTLATNFFWAHKPSNIAMPIVLNTEHTIVAILKDAGDRAQKPYSLTPLDFVERKEWCWMYYWAYWINILRMVGLLSPKPRPLDRLPNDDFPYLGGWSMVFVFFFQSLYAGVLFIGWNFHFPSHTELVMWRVCSVVNFGCILGCWIADRFAWIVLPALKQRFASNQQPQELNRVLSNASRPSAHSSTKVRHVGDQWRQFGNPHDLIHEISLKAALPVTTFAFTYCFARAYVLAEDVVAFRALPPSAYQSVDWSKYLPHF